jgi:tRNA(Ile)-lysidine synthase
MSSRALAFTADHLLQILKSFPVVNSYKVGFSGGADSTALLHARIVIHRQLDVPVSAIHVNHGIHPQADEWQRQCELFCDQHNVDLTCLKVKLENCSGKGLEAEARHLRYESMSALLNPGDCLLTAHHADDQAETLLLNLMRGSGVDGLTAMPESRTLGQGFLQRPLLHFKNSALRDYLHDHHIDWSEDPSNQHLNHDRNFVRHEVIPLLEQRWPKVNQRLLLTQQAMTDARQLLEKLADEYLDTCLTHPFVLTITPACRENPELFKLVIRRWTKQSGATSISAYKLSSLSKQVQNAGSDNKISSSWGGWLLHWYKDQLWLRRDEEILRCPTVKWTNECNEVSLGKDLGQLVLAPAAKLKHDIKQDDRLGSFGEVSVCSRIDLEKAVIRQDGMHKSLKKLFQSADIPPWLRNSIPLCRLDGKLVAVGDWCFDEQFGTWLSEHDYVLSWRPQHPLLQFINQRQHTKNR